MRKIAGWFLLLALAVGCSRAPVPTRPITAPNVLKPTQPAAVTMTDTEKAAQLGAALQQAPDPRTRDQVVALLRGLGEKGTPHLLEGLKHKSWEVRLESLRALDKDAMLKHADQTWPALEKMLEDEHPVLRAAAIGRMTAFHDKDKAKDKTEDALRLLKDQVDKDPDLKTRYLASAALINLYRGDIDKLAALLKDKNAFLRKQVATHFGGIESAPQKVMDYLKPVAAHDPDKEVQQAARDSLQALERQNLLKPKK